MEWAVMNRPNRIPLQTSICSVLYWLCCLSQSYSNVQRNQNQQCPE